jgi:hypothetical protein
LEIKDAYLTQNLRFYTLGITPAKGLLIATGQTALPAGSSRHKTTLALVVSNKCCSDVGDKCGI